MAAEAHPRFNLTPGTLSNMYHQALLKEGYGVVKGWHWPPGYDAAVEMEDGRRFYLGVGPGGKVVITPYDQ
jgi:hypothetical protein